MVVFLLLACCFKINFSFTIDGDKWLAGKIGYTTTLSSTTLDIVGAASGSDGTSIYLFGGTPEKNADSPYTEIHKYTPSSDELTIDAWINWGVSTPSEFVIGTNKYSQSISPNGATYISAIDWKAVASADLSINKFYAQLDSGKSAEVGTVSDPLYNTQSVNSRGCVYIFEDLAYITGKADRSIDAIDVNVSSIALNSGNGQPENAKMHACVLYNDSRAYTFGGEDYESSAYIIPIHACEPDYSSCTEISNTYLPWQHLQAVVVDELIFIAGGSIQDETPYSYADIYVFDPATNQFLVSIPDSKTRVDSHIHYLPDSKQLVFIGGKTCGTDDTYCNSGNTILIYTFYELTDSPTTPQPTRSPTMFPTAGPTSDTTSPTMPPSFPPTTVAPTTSDPTISPTTNVPTTYRPTTNTPTTDAPTTNEPTTSTPTTSAPTTNVPTTSAPTTNVPTTFVPSTAAPTTNVPTKSEGQAVVEMDTTETDQQEGESNIQSNSGSSGNFYIIYGVVGGVVLIGIVVVLIILILKQKSKQNDVFPANKPHELMVIQSNSYNSQNESNVNKQKDGDFGQMLDDKSIGNRLMMDEVVDEMDNITPQYPQGNENNLQVEPGFYRAETFEVNDDEGNQDDLIAGNITAGNHNQNDNVGDNVGDNDDDIVEIVDDLMDGNITKGGDGIGIYNDDEVDDLITKGSPEHDMEVVDNLITKGFVN